MTMSDATHGGSIVEQYDVMLRWKTSRGHGTASPEELMIAYGNAQTWALFARFEDLDCHPMIPMAEPMGCH